MDLTGYIESGGKKIQAIITHIRDCIIFQDKYIFHKSVYNQNKKEELDKLCKQITSLLELFSNYTKIRDVFLKNSSDKVAYDKFITGDMKSTLENDDPNSSLNNRLYFMDCTTIYDNLLEYNKHTFLNGGTYYEITQDFYDKHIKFYESYKKRSLAITESVKQLTFSNELLKKEVEAILHKNDLLLKYEDVEKVEEILKQEQENVEKNQISKQSALKDNVYINQDNNDNSKTVNEMVLREEITYDENNTQQPETGQKLENNETITDNTQPQAVESLGETSPNPSAINNNAGEVTEDVVENQTAEENLENETVDNVKDFIISKVLFGLIVERSKNKEFQKIKDLELQLQHEIDEATQNDIQKQIDDIKSSWKLKVENQNDSFEIGDTKPNFEVTNDYKILNNYKGVIDKIYAGKDNNSINISHAQNKDVNYSSINVSINKLCQHMEDNKQIPFTFNFNTKTGNFIDGICESLFSNLSSYAENGMNAICIDGKTIQLSDLQEHKDKDEFFEFIKNERNEYVKSKDRQTPIEKTDTPEQTENIDNVPNEQPEETITSKASDSGLPDGKVLRDSFDAASAVLNGLSQTGETPLTAEELPTLQSDNQNSK